VVRLRYLADTVTLSVSDNGTGDPAQLRRALRLSCAADLSGRHRGLANMLAMAEELGGTLSIRRSRSGGVLLRLDTPLSLLRRSEADGRPPAQGHDGDA
jgi:signal transduction histidine kinase